MGLCLAGVLSVCQRDVSILGLRKAGHAVTLRVLAEEDDGGRVVIVEVQSWLC